MNPSVIKAVEGHRTLRFRYKGKVRTVEPHTYGIRLDGTEALCAWQTEGGSGEDFRLYLEAEMSELTQGAPFPHARAGYQPGDSRFRHVYAELPEPGL